MPTSLLAAAERRAADAGLNLFGVVDAARFDACQPKEARLRGRWPWCGTVVVVGSGGGRFWQQFATNCAQAAATRTLPAPQEFASRCVHEIAHAFADRKVEVEVVEPGCQGVNFLRLAEAAGFGTVSPVSGQLLHPVFGPHVALRGALLFAGLPFGAVADASITDRFQPCCTCRQQHPSADRLPAPTPCATHLGAGACSAACVCRSACPLGAEHRTADLEVGPGQRGRGGSWLRLRVLRLFRR